MENIMETQKQKGNEYVYSAITKWKNIMDQFQFYKEFQINIYTFLLPL